MEYLRYGATSPTSTEVFTNLSFSMCVYSKVIVPLVKSDMIYFLYL